MVDIDKSHSQCSAATEHAPSLKEAVRGAVARGWCSRDNEHKEMDVALAESIFVEVWAEVAAHVHTFPDAQSVEVTPIAWTNKMQLSFLKDPAYAEIPMAMWGKSCNYADIPLYAAQQPAAPVETEDNCSCGGGDASGHDSMCPERSSAGIEGEIDFNDPLTSRIMGAARLHTHDHTMAYNITRDVLAVLDEPQPTRETIARAICCPKGCVRDDDCLADQRREQREAVDTIMAALSLSRPAGDSK